MIEIYNLLLYYLTGVHYEVNTQFTHVSCSRGRSFLGGLADLSPLGCFNEESRRPTSSDKMQALLRELQVWSSRL